MIRLESVNSQNIWDIIKLKVCDDQKDFVASNTESILEAYVTEKDQQVALPFAIYEDDTLVGFTMLGYGRVDEDDPKISDHNFCLWRLMIDQRYQNKGYGKQAIHIILDYMRSHPSLKAEYCWLSYEKENTIAQSLYKSLGFIENGEVCDGEIVACLKL